VKTILHLSDLHFGPPFVEAAGDAILEHVKTGAFDVIVITGDLTQRARLSQFMKAGAFLKKLEVHAKVLVIPGNHDIPLFRFWERVFHPYRLFHDWISKSRDTKLEFEDLVIVGVDTTHPFYRISGGFLNRAKVQFFRSAFEAAPPKAYRLLALHHPLYFREERLTELLDAQVDLVLCGHAHTRLVQRLGDGTGRPLVLVQCGTSTSQRGRREEMGKNSINEIRLNDHGFEVRELELDVDHRTFSLVRTHDFSRT